MDIVRGKTRFKYVGAQYEYDDRVVFGDIGIYMGSRIGNFHVLDFERCKNVLVYMDDLERIEDEDN
jgi:hypothetical protein